MIAEYVFRSARLDQTANQLERSTIVRSAIHEIPDDPEGELIAEGIGRALDELDELRSAALYITDENSLHLAFRDARFAPISPSPRRDSTIDQSLRSHFRSSLRPADIDADHARFQHQRAFR